MSKMPVLFIGHGSPMNTLEANGYTVAWRAFGKMIPTPKAILSISAHWFMGNSSVTAMKAPRTIHDFYGFTQELFDFEYAAPGSPEIAERVAEIAKPTWVGLDRDQWGLDHGTWSVLAHMYPKADIPVVELSLNALKPLDYHINLGAMLAPMREEGVLILGSGNVVHNLGEVQRDRPDHGESWAKRFDDAVAEQMAGDPGNIGRVTDHPNFRRAVPTPEHFLPLAYVAGLAATDECSSKALLRGYSMGSLSMSCYGVGADQLGCQEGKHAATVPGGVDPEHANL